MLWEKSRELVTLKTVAARGVFEFASNFSLNSAVSVCGCVFTCLLLGADWKLTVFSVVRLGRKHGGIWRGTAEWVTLQNVPGSHAERGHGHRMDDIHGVLDGQAAVQAPEGWRSCRLSSLCHDVLQLSLCLGVGWYLWYPRWKEPRNPISFALKAAGEKSVQEKEV